jgi:predicted kinase
MPTYTMLIGVPGSGKSSWLNQQWSQMDDNELLSTVVASTDDYIEKHAQQLGKTYSEVFATEIKAAGLDMNNTLQQAFANSLNVIHDQTNLSVKARKAKLSQVPRHYQKVAVFFATPEPQELQRRLDNRVGKTIPPYVISNMIQQLELPTRQEGFDKIVYAN